MTATAPWPAAAAVALLGAYRPNIFSWFTPTASGRAEFGRAESGPARVVALPGGGFSDGDECGSRGYHYFPLPATASSPEPDDSPDHRGPARSSRSAPTATSNCSAPPATSA
ncbi:hypothetical protein ACGFYV_07890 [Streptomyces sp. NPDC048297]|uniref:hypothetical protein n=1 Tax=Streptomyces sp. NPDC048297 TaxID=3365531 RepID=UPI003719BA12